MDIFKKPQAKELVRDMISELIEKYEADRDTYLKASYNETQVRADFLDPLFELLGWDIKNDTGKPTEEDLNA